MAKGAIITDEVEVLIASIHKKHPKWKAPEVRNTVGSMLHASNSKISPDWPSLSTVQKVMARLRKKEKEPTTDPEEKQFCLATLNQYPIPPETLATVLAVWKSTIELDGEFTIRQAKWVSRLSGLIAAGFLKDTKELSSQAIYYSNLELYHMMLDADLDTTILDILLMKPNNMNEKIKSFPSIFEKFKNPEPDDEMPLDYDVMVD